MRIEGLQSTISRKYLRISVNSFLTQQGNDNSYCISIAFEYSIRSLRFCSLFCLLSSLLSSRPWLFSSSSLSLSLSEDSSSSCCACCLLSISFPPMYIFSNGPALRIILLCPISPSIAKPSVSHFPLASRRSPRPGGVVRSAEHRGKLDGRLDGNALLLAPKNF